MQIDPYKVLGVNEDSSFSEIKLAYRLLVKKHHPDAGGNETRIIELNAAWEILRSSERRDAFNVNYKNKNSLFKKRKAREERNIQASDFVKSVHQKVADEESEVMLWIQNIFKPIDQIIGQIINSFPKKIKELSADPYDDVLMESFCEYLSKSQNKIKKVLNIYQTKSTPKPAKELALSLYHCFSQVEDALNELELYTNGYVDNYLHDGNEMIRKAKKQRLVLKENLKVIVGS